MAASIEAQIRVHRMAEEACKRGVFRAWHRRSDDAARDGLGDVILHKLDGSIVRADLVNAEIILSDALASTA